MKVFYRAILFLCPLYLHAVRLDIDLSSQFNESAPIEGTVIVSHTKEEKIDPSSFKIKNDPLKVELIKEEPMTATGDLILSFYHFKLPPQAKGLYIFPEIKTIVSGKTYQSIARTYEVKGISASPENNMTSGAAQPAQTYQYAQNVQTVPGEKQNYLKLETFVVGPHELYPGQQILAGYRYFYNVNIDTTQETIPLLEAQGLTKIGDKMVTEKEYNGLSVQQIAQKLEAKEPGEYSFGPSVFEGYPYKADELGNKVFSKEKLSSTAPAVIFKVLQFPKENQPASFNGAVGNYQLDVKSTSTNSVHVGDEIDLLVSITGEGNFDSVHLPELCCQPGLSGLFSLSDLPPTGEVTGDSKQFKMKIRPLTPMVKEIPPFEFSFFNPENKQYTQLRSQPIHITVTTLDTKKTSEPTQEAKIEPIVPMDNSVEPIKSESLYPLKESDLHNLPFGNWWFLLIIPLAIGALIFQRNLSKYLAEVQAKPKKQTSDDLFEEALASPIGSAEEHELITRAFLLKLVEKKGISTAEITPEMLPDTGIIGDVRTFLINMEKIRYTQSKDVREEELLKTAKELFKKLKEHGDFA